MATYGAGIAIAGLVNASRSSTGTIYTVPAGNYAILNWDVNASGSSSGTIEMNGAAYASITGAANVSSLMVLSGTGPSEYGGGPIYAGPGQAINTTISGTCTVYLTGPLFNN